VVKKIGNDWYVFQCGALYRQRIRCTLGRAAVFDSSAYRAVVPSCSGEQLHCSFAFYEPSGGILQKGIKAEQKFLGERHSDWWRNSVRYPSSVPRQIMIGTRYGRLACGAAPGGSFQPVFLSAAGRLRVTVRKPKQNASVPHRQESSTSP